MLLAVVDVQLAEVAVPLDEEPDKRVVPAAVQLDVCHLLQLRHDSQLAVELAV